jgi:hypothetical protein
MYSRAIIGSVVLCCAFVGCSVYEQSMLTRMNERISDGGSLDYDVIAAGDGGISDATENVEGSLSVIDGRVSKYGNSENSERTCVQADVEDYCTQLPTLSQAPVIDGELDCGPPLMVLEPVGWNSAEPIPANQVTRFAAASRPDGLYFYVEVRGNSPVPHQNGQPVYCGDAIELYVDADGTVDENGNYDQPGAVQLVVAAPSAQEDRSLDAERFENGVSQGIWISKSVKTVILSDGYGLEAFLVAADLGLWDWPSSDRIGFDIGINIAGDSTGAAPGCGLRLGQYYLRVSSTTDPCGGAPWCDTRSFCISELTPR